MPKPRTRTPEKRKRQILDAARSLLTQKGYQDIKMDDVAKKAQLAKGTLYLHFKDKSQIVTAVFEDLMNQLEEKFLELTGHGLPLLKNVAHCNLNFLRKNQDFFSQFIHLKASFTAADKTIVQKRFHRHNEMIQKFIGTAVKAGEIPKHDPFIGSFYFTSLIRMFWIKDQFKARGKTPDDVKVLMDLFLHGIQGSKKGQKT